MVAAMVRERSDPDDDVLWRGRPQPVAYVLRLWWPAALVSAAVLLVGAAWEWLALSGHHLIVYPLAGTLFLALGVYGLLVRPLLLRVAAGRLRYSVRAERVEWRWGRRSRNVGTLEGDALAPWFVLERRHAVDVVFFTMPDGDPWGLWRLIETRARFVCLSPREAEAAAAAQRAAAPPPRACVRAADRAAVAGCGYASPPASGPSSISSRISSAASGSRPLRNARISTIAITTVAATGMASSTPTMPATAAPHRLATSTASGDRATVRE
jgi:hypothetical protein